MRTNFQHLLISQAGGVLTVTMNRPEVLNAFNDTLLEELGEAMDSAAQDTSVRCVVLTGAGRGFGTGQDLRTFAPRPDCRISPWAARITTRVLPPSCRNDARNILVGRSSAHRHPTL